MYVSVHECMCVSVHVCLLCVCVCVRRYIWRLEVNFRHCFSFLSIVVISIMKKRNLSENCFLFVLLCPHHSHDEGKSRVGIQGRNLKVESEVEPWRKGSYWLVPHGLLILI